MVVLDIKPLLDNARDCIMGNYASVLGWKGKDFEMGYIESWGFAFIREIVANGEKIGMAIDPVLGDFEPLVKKYHGISTRGIDFNNPGDLVKIKKELDEKNPVIAAIDTFHCPWDQSYNLLHRSHIITIIGYDEDSIYIMDPYYSKYMEKFSLDYLEKKIIADFFVILTDGQEEPYDYKEIIKKSVLRIKNEDKTLDSFHYIRVFAGEVENHLDITYEIAGANGFIYAPLFQTLLAVYRGRLRYARLLTYFYRIYGVPELMEFSKRMETIARKWEIARGMFIKFVHLKEIGDQKNIAVNIIRNIADLEEELADDLLQFVG